MNIFNDVFKKIDEIKTLLNILNPKTNEDDAYLPLDDGEINQVPYISTYYIKPIIKPDEEVFIDFFIRDYFGTGILNEEKDDKVYKVIIKIDSKDDVILRGLSSGDHRVSLGVFDNCKEYAFSIMCIDNYGRHSHELFSTFKVAVDKVRKTYNMSESDISKYGIDMDNAREGLQLLIDSKQEEGYDHLVLLNDIYKIDHTAPIYIPNEFTLDLNGSTIQLNGFAGSKALMIDINNVDDAHVVNGTIEGDYYEHDYENSPNNSEWVNGINITGDCKYCSFENLIVKNITGYGGGNGIGPDRNGITSYTHIYPIGISGFKLGDIDRHTGNMIDSAMRTTSDFIDIGKHVDIGYMAVSRYLGYQGMSGATCNILAHFYDKDKQYIKTVDAYQYRRIATPNNAKYARITLLNNVCPTDLNICLFKMPIHCWFKNVKFENCRCVGLAQAAMNNMLVEDCEFVNCGQSSAKCAYDAEDGWDMMQDVTFRRLNFHDNPNNEFLTCAGHNFIVEDMINGDVYIWERTKDFVLRNSNCGNIIARYDQNIYKHGVYRINNIHCNEMIIDKNVGRNIHAKTSVGVLYDSSFNAFGYKDSEYYRCTLTVSPDKNGFVSYLSNNTKMYKCVIKSVNGDKYKLSFNDGSHRSSYEFIECTFEGETVLDNNNAFYDAKFIKCKFDNMRMNVSVCANEDEKIEFIECDIAYNGIASFIEYKPHNYTVGTYSNIIFTNCNITCPNTQTLAYGYAKPNIATLIFDNCNMNIPEMKNVFDCYRSYLTNIKDVTIKFINTESLCYDIASGLEEYNIKIMEE